MNVGPHAAAGFLSCGGWELGREQAELCLGSAGRSGHMGAGSSDMFCATGVGAKLSGLLGSALIQVSLQALIDPIDFSVSTPALNPTMPNTLQNGTFLVLYPCCSA